MQLGIKVSDLFFIFFYLNVFCKGIGLGNSSSIYMGLLLFGGFVLGLKCVRTQYSKRELTIVLLLIVIGIFSLLFTKKPTLMLTCVCLAGMKNIDVERLFSGMYIIRGITFISVVLLSLLGVIENISVYMWRNGGFETRYSLGYAHPNSLHLAFFILIATYIYTHFYRLTLFKCFVVFIANYIVYIFSGSRTGFIGGILLIFLTLIAHRKSLIIKKVLCILPQYLFILILSISFLLAYLYNNFTAIRLLDRLFNGRLSYSNHYVTNYGFSIWGHNLVNESALFDNGYLLLYVQFGIVGLLLVGGLIYLICNDIKKSMDIRKAVLMLTFLVYIFAESFSPNIFMNIILLFAGTILYRDSYVDNGN